MAHATVNQLHFTQIKFPLRFGDYIHFSKCGELYNTPEFSTRQKRLLVCSKHKLHRKNLDWWWGIEVGLYNIYYFCCSIWKEKYAAFFFLSHSLTKLINFYLTNSQSQSRNKFCMGGRYPLSCSGLKIWRRAWENNHNPKSLFFSICSQKYSG